ncbi:hypothetical protein EJ07DRAFT_182431 [Lizonia empirigonia]|nr:hypothetical protein EJ07DRAFT_182431 [Lizonia empirigonia]
MSLLDHCGDEALKITVCPTCLLRLHIFEIAETQAGLERRGGIFASRAAADDALASSSERVCHRVLVRRWRIAKIDLHRDLCQLEALRDETAGTTRWKLQLAKAFELWKEVENECSRMPGYKYCEKSAVVDREGSFVEPEVDFKHKLNEKTLDHAIDEDEGRETIKSRSRFLEQPLTNEVQLGPSPTTGSGDLDMSDTAYYRANSDMQNPDDIILREMEGVTSRLEPDSYWDDRNRFALLREMDEDDHPMDCDPQAIHIFPSKIPGHAPEIGSTATPVRSPKTPANPSLKSQSSQQPPPKHQRSHKTVHFADLTTIICDTAARGTANLPPEQHSYKRLHSGHTTAETARSQSSFNRRAILYVPAEWAVPDGYENVNTSHYNTTWDDYDGLQFLASVQEDVQAEATEMT